MNKFKIGDKVKFFLDNNWPGEGIVKNVWSHSCEVELTTTCKEFEVGSMIIIGYKEICYL